MLLDALASGTSSSARIDSAGSAADWAAEVGSWASPTGLMMHALRPALAEGLRRSGVGQGTEWGGSLQRVLDDPQSVTGFQAGFDRGVFDGAKSLLGGVWDVAKGTAAMAYDGNSLGSGLDALRHMGVGVPDWAPSSERADAKIAAVASGIRDYAAAVARDPAKLGDDVKGWIAANWEGLKADHARAAARGGAAEAEWWGHIAGRATFEVAAFAVPAAKFASVAKAGEALELALKTGRLGETFAEATRVGKLGELLTAAMKGSELPALVDQARSAGRLSELVAEARKIAGGVAALTQQGGLTSHEAVSLGLRPVGAAAARSAGSVDFVTGRLGGEVYSAAKLRALETYLARRGVTLQVGDRFLPPGMAGGFNATERRLLLRDNPTNYEVWHELNHYLQFRKMGLDAYAAQSRVAKEQFVFDSLENATKRWNALTPVQREHAVNYIYQVGGIR